MKYFRMYQAVICHVGIINALSKPLDRLRISFGCFSCGVFVVVVLLHFCIESIVVAHSILYSVASKPNEILIRVLGFVCLTISFVLLLFFYKFHFRSSFLDNNMRQYWAVAVDKIYLLIKTFVLRERERKVSLWADRIFKGIIWNAYTIESWWC